MCDLSGCEMEIPGEVIRPPARAEPAVLTVVGFQSGEVSLQTVCSGRDVRVVEVVEHVGQRAQKHAAGTLDVAEDPTGLLPSRYLGAVQIFPGGDEVEKCFPVCRSSNPCDPEEYLPQLSGVSGLRGVSAPAQPLSLDMYQATLDDRIRPQHPQNLDHLLVAIHSETTWAQAFADHGFEECAELRSGVLADAELSPHQLVSLSVHQDDDAVGAVQEGPVEKEMPGGLRLQGCRWGRIGEEAVGQAVQLLSAVPALLNELAHRISLHHPSAKPLHLLHATGRGIAPAERTLAGAAEPPLTTVRVVAVPQGHDPAPRTVFFGDITP